MFDTSAVNQNIMWYKYYYMHCMWVSYLMFICRVLASMSTCEQECRVTCIQQVLCLAWDIHLITLFIMNSSWLLR